MKFNNILNNILKENKIPSRFFYEAVSTQKFQYQKPLPVLIKTADQFFKNCFPIYDTDIILESSIRLNLINKNLIQRIYNSENFQQISSNEIFNQLTQKVQKQFPIENKQPFYIFKFSFSNPDFLLKIFHYFSIEYSLKSGTLLEKEQNEKQIFKQKFSACNGLCVDLGTYILLILNTDNFSETTIIHELYHYLQLIYPNKNNLKLTETSGINSLNLSLQQLQYLFQFNQFETHIKIDLTALLTEIYYKFYQNKFTKHSFLNSFITLVKNDPDNIVQNLFTLLGQCKNKDITALIVFAACFKIKNKEFLKLAVQWLNEVFS